mmetsp:Transcript_30070/g.36718  ORF Transcript_30070/g.36718 Transcript_30070/m.36718 type:complete len:149 (+) Transcript_30070:95-541(+)|eukprot:CAMPEP_0172507324 /NCGR_PEP_ID=MMETSP1066-20121228/202812_1 /TAXON_ID=671091 /ORGANISM="Coscinodiscus wailesii, Strain CCMP2513" /LENGTH=148 /DNA_ID=CAMNT_0013284839 /DNA_START=90 /DNA_END=536 /DNA_ORIENTATION=+
MNTPVGHRMPLSLRPTHGDSELITFTKIVLQYIGKIDPKLYKPAKMILRECLKEYQERARKPSGDNNLSNKKDFLQGVQTKLKGLVGEYHWRRIIFCFKKYRNVPQRHTSTTTANGKGQIKSMGLASRADISDIFEHLCITRRPNRPN